jgi:hypothetical protein
MLIMAEQFRTLLLRSVRLIVCRCAFLIYFRQRSPPREVMVTQNHDPGLPCCPAPKHKRNGTRTTVCDVHEETLALHGSLTLSLSRKRGWTPFPPPGQNILNYLSVTQEKYAPLHQRIYWRSLNPGFCSLAIKWCPTLFALLGKSWK